MSEKNEGLEPKAENEIIGKVATKKIAKEIVSELESNENGERVLVIRHDNPKQELKLQERKHFSATGNIDTVSRYLKKRVGLINQEATTVFIDREEMTIKIQSNETDHWSDKLGGALVVHPDFVKFGINSGVQVSTMKLGDFFRMHRAFFVDPMVNMNLVTVLKKFEGQVDTTIKDFKEANGNANISKEVVVNSNVPAAFHLKIGLFKGLEPKTIEVETVITVANNGAILVALESPEAQEIIETYKNTVIDTEIAEIEEIAPNVLIIEK